MELEKILRTMEVHLTQQFPTSFLSSRLGRKLGTGMGWGCLLAHWVGYIIAVVVRAINLSGIRMNDAHWQRRWIQLQEGEDHRGGFSTTLA
jgi:hypothetical protein